MGATAQSSTPGGSAADMAYMRQAAEPLNLRACQLLAMPPLATRVERDLGLRMAASDIADKMFARGKLLPGRKSGGGGTATAPPKRTAAGAAGRGSPPTPPARPRTVAKRSLASTDAAEPVPAGAADARSSKAANLRAAPRPRPPPLPPRPRPLLPPPAPPSSGSAFDAAAAAASATKGAAELEVESRGRDARANKRARETVTAAATPPTTTTTTTATTTATATPAAATTRPCGYYPSPDNPPILPVQRPTDSEAITEDLFVTGAGDGTVMGDGFKHVIADVYCQSTRRFTPATSKITVVFDRVYQRFNATGREFETNQPVTLDEKLVCRRRPRRRSFRRQDLMT
jgi:hypothetical protein